MAQVPDYVLKENDKVDEGLTGAMKGVRLRPKMYQGPLWVERMEPGAALPKRATDGSAGYDLYPYDKGIIPAGERVIVGTKLRIQLPPCTYGQIHSRSGLAVKNRVDVCAGVIDRDYRGEVGIVLHNHSKVDYEYGNDKPIAQLVLHHISTPEVLEVSSLKDIFGDTSRGEGGYGSTDKK
jgi:dUTP pyrophosphatase